MADLRITNEGIETDVQDPTVRVTNIGLMVEVKDKTWLFQTFPQISSFQTIPAKPKSQIYPIMN